ncbi:MAG: hypothetical protein FJX39_02780 [Alphaproteobacteria bacterium]|nr:hypothetical protein [Alphaproteobacteria bacterium]
MIAKDTPPGTDIVCINASPGDYGPTGLHLGAVYTLDRIESCVGETYAALLKEMHPVLSYAPPWGRVIIGYELSRFRYLDLPDGLTRLLDEEQLELCR